MSTWIWKVGPFPLHESNYGRLDEIECVNGTSTIAWVPLGRPSDPAYYNNDRTGFVGAIVGMGFCEKISLGDIYALDRWFPHDGTPTGIAAAQREAVRYIEMTLTLEL